MKLLGEPLEGGTALKLLGELLEGGKKGSKIRCLVCCFRPGVCGRVASGRRGREIRSGGGRGRCRTSCWRAGGL